MSHDNTSISLVQQVEVEYREIPGFSGYRVGDDGTVWTCRRKGGNDRTPGRLSAEWRSMRIHRDRKGYCRVNLLLGRRNYSRLVHHLVLEAFVGPRPGGTEACHYPDSDKADNRLCNLRWDTHGENARDIYRDRGSVTEKTCRRCGETKPLSQFYGDRRSTDGHGQRCRSCLTKDAADRYRRASPEVLERLRAYKREYMRRWKIRKKGGGE